ncbi:MAG: hypothetical protein DRI57_19540 [Deltaproteobacteria bacterium]|nr:MAG: hypothetical protein DRI57_19540 [Deltaproteobacteria bacterium]
MTSHHQKHLFLLDADSIQSYIFNTNRLKTIIGASWLIDHINAASKGDTHRLIREADNELKKNKNKETVEFIYSAGGNTKLIFPSAESAQVFDQKIKKAYNRHGISVTTHIHPIKGDANDINRTITPAQKILAQKKYNKDRALNLPASPFFKLCELCGKEYAENIRKDGDDEIVICTVCDQKFSKAEERLRLFPDYEFFTNIEKMKTVKNMIAVVVMDGNNMSAKIRKLGTVDELKQFAQKTEDIIREAFDSCLTEVLPDESCADKKNRKFNTIRPLIIGGDDICLIIAAVYALDFAQHFIKKVETLSKHSPDLFGKKGITFSAGILFIKKNYPFNFAHGIAESLLRSAKRFSKEHGECSALDFHILLSSSGDDIEKTREREYKYDDHVLTQKPFHVGDMENRLEAAENLSTMLARNKVKYLRQALRRSREASMVEMLKLALRMGEKTRGDYIKFLNDYGWQKESDKLWHTGILDLVEITDIVGKKEKDNGTS